MRNSRRLSVEDCSECCHPETNAIKTCCGFLAQPAEEPVRCGASETFFAIGGVCPRRLRRTSEKSENMKVAGRLSNKMVYYLHTNGERRPTS